MQSFVYKRVFYVLIYLFTWSKSVVREILNEQRVLIDCIYFPRLKCVIIKLIN